jgi:outer membrane protein TolC
MKRVALWASLATLLVATRASAQTLSEDETARASVGCSVTIAAAEAQVRAAHADRTAARWGMVPDLTVTGRYTRLSSVPVEFRSLNFTPPGAMPSPADAVVFPQLLDQFAGRVTLTLPITDLVLRAWRMSEAAGAREEARQWERASAMAQVEFESRTAWHEWRRARNAAEAVHAAVENLNAQQRSAADRVTQGTLARTQLQVIEVERSSMRRQELTANGNVAVALRRIQRITCMDSDTLTPGAATAMNDTVRAERRPELRALDADNRALDAQSRAASAAAFPSLSFVANADYAAPNPRAFAQTTLRPLATWDVSIQLSWSLPGAMAALATRRSTEAARDAVDARRIELHRAIDEERDNANTWVRVAEQRRDEARSALETATTLETARRAEFAAGTTAALDVTVAATQRLRAALELQDAEVELDLGHLRQRYAAGLLGRIPRRSSSED